MKEDRLIFKNYFNEPLQNITDVVDRYLGELVKVRPQVVLEVKVTDDKQTWRGYFYEPQAWPDDDIKYGFIEVVRKSDDGTIPVEVNVYASHPNYLVWMVNLTVLLDKHLKLSSWWPLPGMPDWALIPDEGFDRKLVELWSNGYRAKEISSKLYVSERRIYNRLSELRKKYSVTIVPLRIKRKNTKKSVNTVN